MPTLTDEEAKWYDMQSSNTGAFLHRSESNFGEVVVPKGARKYTVHYVINFFSGLPLTNRFAFFFFHQFENEGKLAAIFHRTIFLM